MAAVPISVDVYCERILDFLRTQAEPLTTTQIREMIPRPAGQSAKLNAAIEELELRGVIVRGETRKCGHVWTTWRTAGPINRLAGIAGRNGHTNGHAAHSPELKLPFDEPLTFFDAKKIVEDLFLGIESLKVQAEQLEVALTDWPNLPIGEIIMRHCHATGKDRQSLILREILPLLIEAEAHP